MVSNSESQCYFVQLQFDTYLDGELGTVQRQEFQSHVQQCETCAREFQYAQTLHDYVLDMPLLDCPEQVLEPIHRLGGSASVSSHQAGFWQGVQAFINTVPMFFRYAVPVALLAVLVVPLATQFSSPAQEQPLVAEQAVQATDIQYTPEEIQQALLDLNLAIQYLNGVGQRTEAMIGERFLMTPLQESLDASFEVIRRVNADPLQNDPI